MTDHDYNTAITINKMYMASQYIESQLLGLKGGSEFVKESKNQLNITLKHFTKFCKLIEKQWSETSIENNEENVERLGNIIEILVEAEFKGIGLAFDNDFNYICKKNRLKGQL